MNLIELNGLEYKLVSVNSLSESVYLAFDTLSTWTTSSLGYGYYGCVGKYGVVSVSKGPYTSSSYSTNVISCSTDGLSWSTKQLPVKRNWSGVAYAHGYYVACCYDNDSVFACSRGNSSFSWSTFSVDSRNKGSYIGIASNGELFVANTTNHTYTSQFINNSVTFSTISYQPYTSMSAIKSANGYFFAFNSSTSSNCKYSPDGISWHQHTMPIGSNWIDVSYNPIIGSYLFVSSSGETCATTNLSETSTTAPKIPSSNPITSLTCLGNRYYAVSGTSNKHYTISDLSGNWKEESISVGTVSGVNVLAYGNRICTIGGTNERSAPIASFSWKSLDSSATSNMETALKTMIVR